MPLPVFLFKRNFYKILTIIWVALIFIVSSIPKLPDFELEINKYFLRLDYFFHFTVFFLLAIFIVFWRLNENLKINFLQLLIILIAGGLFAFGDEYHQIIIPGRRYNIVDFYYNIIGFFLGIILTYFFFVRLIIVRFNKFQGLKSKYLKLK